MQSFCGINNRLYKIIISIPIMRVTRGAFLLLLCVLSHSYLQLPLIRIPNSGKVTSVQSIHCRPGLEEVCYTKDIAYCIELIHNQQVHLMAVDFTIPISWMKNPDCQVQGGGKCKLIDNSISEKLRTEIKTIKGKFRKSTFDDDEDSKPVSSQKFTLQSVQPITGYIEKGENVSFWTRDSNKLVSLYKLFLVGLFMSGEKDKMLLKNTNFINATQISSQTNKLSDGAISVRFDSESQNSFLYQIFDFVGEQEKTLTIYLGPNSTITLGDLSTKNAEYGYSSISWLPLNSKRELMIDQIVLETIGSEKVSSFETSSEAVFTLSASYIALPSKYIDQIIRLLDAKCRADNTTTFMVCSNPSKSFWSKRVIFQILETKVVFEMQELLRYKDGKEYTLHLKQGETDRIIMGQPFFKKYYSAFDYLKNRIGIAERRKSSQQKILDVITLVRFLTVVFISGCSIIVCYRPVKRLIKVAGVYRKMEQNESNIYESRKLKYSHIQAQTRQEYDELNTQIRNALEAPVEGI